MCMLIEGFNCAAIYKKEGKPIFWLRIRICMVTNTRMSHSAPDADCANLTSVLAFKISKTNVCNKCTACKMQKKIGVTGTR